MADVAPVQHEGVHAAASAIVTAVPFLCLGFVAWQVWDRALHWHDLVVFAATYIPIGLGVTVGFHRHFTHRSFKTPQWLRGLFGVLGSAALEGPVISWVAAHRKHHAFSDQEGDPHSPHVDHGGNFSGALRGLFHAHLGWLFLHTHAPDTSARYAPDLLDEPVTRGGGEARCAYSSCTTDRYSSTHFAISSARSIPTGARLSHEPRWLGAVP